MSSKIKVDTIENVAGSGNVSLGSGHNLVVPGNLTVDTSTFKVDASSNKVLVGTTTPASFSTRLFTVGDTSFDDTALEIRSSTGTTGRLYFTDASDTSTGAYKGGIVYDQANDFMRFETDGGNERVRIDNSGRVMIGTDTEGLADGDNLTVSGSGAVGITVRSTNSGQNNLYFSDATSGAGEYAGYVTYEHSLDTLRLGAGGADVLRCLNAISGSGYTADSGSMVASHPMVAIRATGQSRTDTYYDFPVDNNGGLYVIAGMSHDQSPGTYGKFANFQIGHNATYMTVFTSEAQGGNGQCAVSKPNNTTLRVTFNKDESSGSGTYGTVEFVAVFGSNPF